MTMAEPIEVLITQPFSDELIDQLRGVSPRIKITAVRAKKPEDVSPEMWKKVEVLYTAKVLPEPEQVEKLRWIQFHSAGIDHATDHPIFSKPDLIATTLSGAAASQVAEFAVLMMLALGRRLPELINFQKRAEWPSDRGERFMPLELRGSTVGIVGYGSIGRQIANLLRPFGAEVLALKRDPMQPQDRGYIPEGQGDPGGDLVKRLYPPQAIRSLMKECDFVVVTIPLTRDTSNMIGPDELAVLKPDAYLIDVSRGGVVNSSALYNALKDKKLAGAALDVHEEEPLPSNSPFWKLPNVFITPHISGNTAQYDQRAVDLFIENLNRFLAGKTLYNEVDIREGY
jgi:phosphoglycerate dehydrogenase-like enzyme